MKGTMLVYRTNQLDPEVENLDDTVPLDKVQKLVGGYIELVPQFDTIVHNGRRVGCVVFCNEDGHRLRLDVNSAATLLWRDAVEKHPLQIMPDVLLGTVIVLTGDREFMESL